MSELDTAALAVCSAVDIGFVNGVSKPFASSDDMVDVNDVAVN